MSTPISGDSVLHPTPWCSVREQEERYLVYNRRTDEMHLVPPTGFYVYRLCDGTRTVGDVEAELAAALDADPGDLHRRLEGFLAALLARGILEAAS